VNGRDFEPGAGVLVGGRYGQTSFINPNTLAVQVPQGESGPVDVTVSNPDGETATLPQTFLYNEPPRIRSVTADPNPIVRLTTSTIKVDAFDPEIGPLEYEFRVMAGDGTVIGQGNEAKFSSANTTGRIIVEVAVYDQFRARTTGTIDIIVQ
jgi:hypothetical protein